jgi:hypothetical protein
LYVGGEKEAALVVAAGALGSHSQRNQGLPYTCHVRGLGCEPDDDGVDEEREHGVCGEEGLEVEAMEHVVGHVRS